MDNILIIDRLFAPIGRGGIDIPKASFETGKLHIIIGANGSGKSSLLRVIQGFAPIESGTVEWYFSDIDRIVLSAKERPIPEFFDRVGFMQQGSDSLWPQFTAKEHVERAIQNRADRVSAGRVTEVLKLAQIESGKWNDYPVSRAPQGQAAMLSGGERQRIAFARAIAAKPDILICDELEASLDEEVRGRFIDWVLRAFLPEGGKTAIVVTHDSHNWLGGEWRPGDRKLWQVTKDQRGIIGLAPKPDPKPVRNATQLTVAANFDLQARLANISGLDRARQEAWKEVGQHLAVGIRDFLQKILEEQFIVMVLGAGGAENAETRSPMLLSATGSIGLRPDGCDADILSSFLDNGRVPQQPRVGSATLPSGQGLIDRLIRLQSTDAYQGNRVDYVSYGDQKGEIFSFETDLLDAVSNQEQDYLELLKEARSVYLLRILRSNLPEDARLVVSIDFNDSPTLDAYQRIFLIEALRTALSKLAP